MAGLDKFDAEELAQVFDEIFDMFSTDDVNAQIIERHQGDRNEYDESNTQWETPTDIHLIEIGDPLKQDFTTAGDLGTSRTWFVVKPEIAKLITTGTKIAYSPHPDIPKRNYIVRVMEIKNLRGSLIIGYGMMERIAT